MNQSEPEIIRQSLERLVERLRSATEDRLNRSDDRLAGESLASATYDLAAWCVSAFALHTGTAMPTLPRLDAFASGDQLWVTAIELLNVIDIVNAVDPGSLGSDGSDSDVLNELHGRIERLRSVS